MDFDNFASHSKDIPNTWHEKTCNDNDQPWMLFYWWNWWNNQLEFHEYLSIAWYLWKYFNQFVYFTCLLQISAIMMQIIHSFSNIKCHKSLTFADIPGSKKVRYLRNITCLCNTHGKQMVKLKKALSLIYNL